MKDIDELEAELHGDTDEDEVVGDLDWWQVLYNPAGLAQQMNDRWGAQPDRPGFAQQQQTAYWRQQRAANPLASYAQQRGSAAHTLQQGLLAELAARNAAMQQQAAAQGLPPLTLQPIAFPTLPTPLIPTPPAAPDNNNTDDNTTNVQGAPIMSFFREILGLAPPKDKVVRKKLGPHDPHAGVVVKASAGGRTFTSLVVNRSAKFKPARTIQVARTVAARAQQTAARAVAALQKKATTAVKGATSRNRPAMRGRMSSAQLKLLAKKVADGGVALGNHADKYAASVNAFMSKVASGQKRAQAVTKIHGDLGRRGLVPGASIVGDLGRRGLVPGASIVGARDLRGNVAPYDPFADIAYDLATADVADDSTIYATGTPTTPPPGWQPPHGITPDGGLLYPTVISRGTPTTPGAGWQPPHGITPGAGLLYPTRISRGTPTTPPPGWQPPHGITPDGGLLYSSPARRRRFDNAILGDDGAPVPDPLHPGYLTDGSPDPSYGGGGTTDGSGQGGTTSPTVPGPPDYGAGPAPTAESVAPQPFLDFQPGPDPQSDLRFYDCPTDDDLPLGAIVFDGSRQPPFQGLGNYTVFFGVLPESAPPKGGPNSGYEWHGSGGFDWALVLQGTQPSTGYSGGKNYDKVDQPSGAMVFESNKNNWGPLMGNPQGGWTRGLRFTPTGPNGPRWFWFYDQAPSWAQQPILMARMNDAITSYKAAVTAGQTDFLNAQLQDQLDAADAAKAAKAQAIVDAQVAQQQELQQAQQSAFEQQQAQQQAQLDLQYQQQADQFQAQQNAAAASYLQQHPELMFQQGGGASQQGPYDDGSGLPPEMMDQGGGGDDGGLETGLLDDEQINWDE